MLEIAEHVRSYIKHTNVSATNLGTLTCIKHWKARKPESSLVLGTLIVHYLWVGEGKSLVNIASMTCAKEFIQIATSILVNHQTPKLEMNTLLDYLIEALLLHKLLTLELPDPFFLPPPTRKGR